MYIRDAQVSLASLNNPDDYAILTCPPESLYIANSSLPDAGLGVFARRCIPEGTYFGPYIGVKTRTIPDNQDHKYAWALYAESCMGFMHYIDGYSPRISNWLRYVNCPDMDYQQNLISIQYDGDIYYQAIRNIQADEELFVYYGDNYAMNLGINTTQLFENLEHIPKRTM